MWTISLLVVMIKKFGIQKKKISYNAIKFSNKKIIGDQKFELKFTVLHSLK